MSSIISVNGLLIGLKIIILIMIGSISAIFLMGISLYLIDKLSGNKDDYLLKRTMQLVREVFNLEIVILPILYIFIAGMAIIIKIMQL